MSKRPHRQNRAMNPDPGAEHIRDPQQDRNIAEQRSENAARPDEQPPRPDRDTDVRDEA